MLISPPRGREAERLEEAERGGGVHVDAGPQVEGAGAADGDGVATVLVDRPLDE